MFMQNGLGAVYDIEVQVPKAASTGYGPWAGGPDIFQALPQMIDWYLTLKQNYLTLQNNAMKYDPISQAAIVKEFSIDIKRLQQKAANLAVTFGYTLWENGYNDTAILNYGMNLIEKAGLQNEDIFKNKYYDSQKRIQQLTGQIAAELTTVQQEQASFASVIASLKAQLSFAKQQLAQTETTLQNLREQAAALGITSW